jgi:hypothetical protein
MKNKKYHTVGTVPKYHAVGTVPKYHAVGTVPRQCGIFCFSLDFRTVPTVWYFLFFIRF